MYKKLLMEKFGIDEKVYSFCAKAERNVKDKFALADEISEYNQAKIVAAMQKNKLSEAHLSGTTGYGYNDIGRDTLENIYASVFNAEDALVRQQIISGTHALTVALFGNLKYGDEMVCIGTPYDTLQSVIGYVRPVKGSLVDNGIKYKEVPLLDDGTVDFDGIKKIVTKNTKLVEIQRSKGYDYRPSLEIPIIKKIIDIIRTISPDIICMVDNCYGEFVDYLEPTDVGADLMVGSLIKNPGGGLAPVGGYIVGKKELVENASYRLTVPSMGKEVGPSLGVTSTLIQGLFLAPSVVNSSLKTAIFTSEIFSQLGYEVMPKPNDKRTDIVESIQLKTPEAVIAFCQGIQMGAAVDSFVLPEPWDMPGYDCDVIMAAGAFVQGSSIELSADAPMKEPYTVFMQGGLTWQHGKLGVIIAINNMYKKGIIKL
ncbi:MAG: aminotransferase class I/II-fold pyridoxal phosphate-dependent enzyme [Lachnospirales bacterium]